MNQKSSNGYASIIADKRMFIDTVRKLLPNDLELILDGEIDDLMFAIPLKMDSGFIVDIFNYTFKVSPWSVEQKFARYIAEEAKQTGANFFNVRSDKLRLGIFNASCYGSIDLYKRDKKENSSIAEKTL